MNAVISTTSKEEETRRERQQGQDGEEGASPDETPFIDGED